MKKILLLFFFGATAYAQPNINEPKSLSACVENSGSSAIFDLTVNNEVLLRGQNLNEFTITYYENATNAESGVNQISVPQSYYSFGAVVFARVTEIADISSYSIASFTLTALPNLVISDIPTQYFIDNDNIADGNVTIDLTALNEFLLNETASDGIEITYYLSQSNAQSGNDPIVNAYAYSATTQTIYVKAENIVTSCVSIASFDIIVYDVVPAPTGESIQNYTTGQTLDDLVLEGQNIIWYATDGSGAFPGGTESPLPITTALSNASTYYATQTIQGYESSDRLQVTAYDVLMSISESEFVDLIYYPNPVENILTIINETEINSVTITNMIGQYVAKKEINSTNSSISFSNLSSGIYIVTISSSGKNKILKIIKK